MNFTDSPYEKMMTQVPRPTHEGAVRKPPRRCRRCGYWNGTGCMGVCYRDLLLLRREATSGQVGPK